MKASYRHNFDREDFLRHEVARLEAENRDLHHQLRVARFLQLTAVITLAIARGDKERWATAVAERMQLGVTDAEMIALTEAA